MTRMIGVVIVSFARSFWRSARRPAVFRRCSLISVVVRTLLTVVNQFDALASGITAPTALGIAANYVIPFIVSNLGAMSAQPEA
jgi:putative flippase GtrA